MKNKILYIFLFFLIAAISLSPRIPLGKISDGRSLDLRVEDILIFVGLIFWIGYFIKQKNQKFEFPPLSRPIIAITVFGLLCVLINIFLGTITFDKGFFYFAKEIEFFVLYFLVFECTKRIGNIDFIKNSWMIFGYLNILWLQYVAFMGDGRFIFYGPNTFMEPKGPFPSGGFFLILFIFLFNIFLFYNYEQAIPKIKKVSLLVLSALPVIGMMSSGSRASALGVMASLPISFFMFLRGKFSFAKIGKIIIYSVIIIGIILSIFYLSAVSKRAFSLHKMVWEITSSREDSRISILKQHIDIIKSDPKILIFGVGIFGEAHSQYMRIVLERGVLGFVFFLWLIWSILKFCWDNFSSSNNLNKGLMAGVVSSTIAMLVMSVPNDPFFVVKIAEPFWFFIAVTIGFVVLNKKQYN